MAMSFGTIVFFILPIVLTLVIIVLFIFIHKVADAQNTKYPWCYGDWQCRAPSTEKDLEVFNSVNTAACNKASCTPEEAYNVYDMVISKNPQDKCKDPADDSEAVVIDLKTGCLCYPKDTPTVPCTIAQFDANDVEGCEQATCGRFNSECGTYVIHVPTDSTYSAEVNPVDWQCPGTTPVPTASGTTYNLCSFMCGSGTDPNPLITSDFFMNAFVYRYKNEVG
jgi:hypothetical protein